MEDRLDEVVPKELGPRRVGRDPEPAIVYKIHGSFSDDAAGLVVSEDDYVQFLATMSAGGKRGMPRLISQMVVDSSLLLLGYGLEDWDFRTIYKALIEGLPRDERWMSYAVQREPTPLWVDFWAGKGVRIFDHDLVDLANDLRLKFQLDDVGA